VVINGMGDVGAIEAERAGMAKKFGVTAIYSGADMTTPDEIRAMVKETEAKLGSVDILVNNAGVQHVAPIEEFPRENWDMKSPARSSHAVRRSTGTESLIIKPLGFQS
jgi:3-hydroxybutyrate dehydrogenase